jgi:protein O-mannosyl-transferase
VLGALLFLGAVTALAIAVRRSRPWIPVGWLWYLGTLVPVIGVIQVGRQAMADRYTYVPHLGIFLAVVWTIGELPLWRARTARAAGATATALLLLVLGGLTFRQTRIWHDTLTFWTYTARTSPSSFIAHQALAGLYFGNRPDEAITQYRWAVHLRPEHADSHARLGLLLARKGKLGPAAAQYRKAVALRPDSADDHNGLGDVLLRQGHRAQARRHLERALAIKPAFAEAHDNLGRLHLAEGRVGDAIAEFQAALRAKPGFANAQRDLDAALERQRSGT